MKNTIRTAPVTTALAFFSRKLRRLEATVLAFFGLLLLTAGLMGLVKLLADAFAEFFID